MQSTRGVITALESKKQGAPVGCRVVWHRTTTGIVLLVIQSNMYSIVDK